jgi:signal transduction histidine kinase
MSLFSTNVEIIFAVAAGTCLLFSLVIYIILFIRQYHRAQQKFDWERQQHKQALLQTEIEIREQTLDHMARELHDNLGQIASLIKINLNLISPDLKKEDREKVDESIDLLKRLITDIKSLSLTLNSEAIIRLGLCDSIRQDVERINRMGNIKIEFACKDLVSDLKPDTVIFLYRMCQEALNNIIKHAGATEAFLEVDHKDNLLTILITDNGKGFDTAIIFNNSQATSSGLANLHKRCHILGAGLMINSSPGAGTKIYITLPVDPNRK